MRIPRPDFLRIAGPARHRRVRTPTILQMEAVECGAAALGIMLAYFGRRVSLEELRISCGVSRDGSKASNIVRAARQYGLVAKGMRLEPATVLNGPFPRVVFWSFNHFLVVEGASDDRIWLNDPATGPRTVTPSEFDEGYTGVALQLEPGPDFATGGSTPSTLVRLARYVSRSHTALGFMLAVSLLMVVPGVMIPGLTQVFVDRYLVRGSEDWLLPLVIGAMITLGAHWILLWLQQYSLRRLELRLALASSARFFWHMLRLPIEFYQQRRVGDLVDRANGNDRVATLLSGDLGASLLDVITVIFFVAIMALYDVELTLVTVALATINVGVLLLLDRRRKDLSIRLQLERGRLFGTSVNGLQLVETLKANGDEDDFFVRWAGYHARVTNTEQRLSLLTEMTAVVPIFLAAVNMTVILGLGGLTVIEGGMTLGALVAFQGLAVSFNFPIQRLVAVGGRVQEISADLARLDDVYAYREDWPFRPIGPTSRSDAARSRLDGQVVFEKVTFGYSRLEPPLIEEFSLVLKPGQRVALVGASGSGKSTIAKLATGLCLPWAGTVRLDGVPLTDLPRDLVANSLSLVDQDQFQFAGSLRENLRLWDASVPQHMLTRAARDAMAHELIISRTDGYDGPMEQGGAISAAASPSGWRSPAPWSTSPRSWCWTRPPRHWTRPRRPGCSTISDNGGAPAS